MDNRFFTCAVTSILGLTCLGCPAEEEDGPDSSAMDDSTGGQPTADTEDDDPTGDPAPTGDPDPSAGTSGGTDGETDEGTTDGGESGDEEETGQTTGAVDEPGPDLREPGPFAVDLSSGNAALPTGCSMGYDQRAPAGMPDAPVVVLAHGFMSNRGTMAGWAEHWASWGLRVVTPDLCHATIADADHPQNGADLQALVDELSLGPVVYAGYSAGGLAAVIAASGDAQTVALLGLDMVDSGGDGAGAASSVTAPAFALVGEPSTCNETNNGIPVFAGAGGQSLRVTAADHCDFQSPADFLCGLTCPAGSGVDEETIAATVRGMSTAVVVWQTGLEPTGSQWWTPGAHYWEELSSQGVLQLP